MHSSVQLQPGRPEIPESNQRVAFKVALLQVESDRQLFGIFESGWDFLMTQWQSGSSHWAHVAPDDRVDVANDLVEKAIRNRMIREAWNAAVDS